MKRCRKNLIHSRILTIVIYTFLIFVILILRLLYIQTIKSEEYTFSSLRQRGREIEVYPSRGIIYDKNFISLTNRNKVPTMILVKDKYIDEDIKKFILKYGEIEDVENYINDNANKIIEIPLKRSIDDDIPEGVHIIDKTYRYDKNNILAHVVGYVKKSDNIGESGIEKVFDEVLKNNENNNIYFEMDNKRNIIPGGGYTIVANEKLNHPNNVQLTIDYHIQKIVEEEMDKRKVKGATIVADVKTGEIVAMASRPNFDQDNIDDYLKKNDMELYNKAIQVSYPPGSLFKVVVLLSALEENPNIINEHFYCKGYETVNDVSIRCNKEKGHGYISLEEAFAKSCNSTFIQLGKKVGSQKIIDMAKRLGYGEKLNVGLLEEVEGNLPKGKELIGPSIGNISIGQGEIEVTPLQVTNMMMILANNGIEKDLSIIKGIVTEEGYMVKKFRKESERRVISEENSKIANKYMEEVVLNGTAKSMRLEDIGGACGKTGSAQAVLNGKKTIHGWFSGYFPVEDPRYVITVFVEEGYSSSSSAVPLFEKITKEIWLKNR